MSPTDAATGVTWLFVPGDRPDRFDKALGSGADRVIVDLEDAVDPTRKDEARDHVVVALADRHELWVRVNAAGSADCLADLAALTSTAARPAGVIVPKADNPDAVALIAQQLGVSVIALVETAAGVLAAPELARTPGVVRLAFGGIDYAADIGAQTTDDVFLYPRSVLVVASRAAGIPAPLDSPSVQFGDPDAVKAAASVARRLGMGGKLCIHPAQLNPVTEAFGVTAEEIAWAHAVLAAAQGTGAAAVGAEMIDKPVLDRARRIRDSTGAPA